MRSSTVEELRDTILRMEDGRCDSATCLLVLLNLAVFAYEHMGIGTTLPLWYLRHDSHFQAWQLVTSMFCHRDYAHLSSNMFGLYVFGRSTEARVGAFGLIVAYLVCGVFANIVSKATLHGSIASLGASGAVFGLFVVASLTNFKPTDPRALIEFLVLGQYAFTQVSSEVVGQARVGVNKTAHVAGAVGGLLAYWLVRTKRSSR
eukprot:TRINITY_DN27515_c0_g1_i2.p1 TRINITY_DN27515_c0_g1~~TRINITY_DN27515_c0_g1_i2.p1  ORF type:complete len:204 (+),score=20.79 TRINITY_DN27515_c0_g1_i2:608-1219(+)